jgi:hypothetical protein
MNLLRFIQKYQESQSMVLVVEERRTRFATAHEKETAQKLAETGSQFRDQCLD